MKRLLCVVKFDSNLKASLNIAGMFEKNGYTVSYFVLLPDYMIDKKHHKEIGFDRPYTNGTEDEIINSDMLLESDVILLDCDGKSIYQFNMAFNNRFKKMPETKRPVLIAGYHGIVYERRTESFFFRSGVDIFYLNSPYDLQYFQYLSQNMPHCSETNLALTGLPFLDLSYNPDKNFHHPYKTILFAAQPTVPESHRQRFWLMTKLVEFARLNPDKKVIFKPRHKPRQFTLKVEKFSYEKILKTISKKKGIPENFILTYTAIIDLIEQADLILTVSSTAAFEAYNLGKAVGFLTDFDITEESGSYYFIGSGCQLTFRDLFNNKVMIPNPDWWESKFLCDGDNTLRLFQVTDKLVENQKDGNPLPVRAIAKYELQKEFYRVKFDNKIPLRRKVTDFLLSIYYKLKKMGIVE